MNSRSARLVTGRAPALSLEFDPPSLKLKIVEPVSYLNEENQAIEMVLVKGGCPLVPGTKLNGKRVLRSDIVNRQVTESGVEAISDAPGFCENEDVSLDKAIQPGRQQMITKIVVHS